MANSQPLTFIDKNNIRGPKVDDISFEVENCDLQQFRDVIDPLRINFSKYVTKIEQSVHYEKLSKFVDHIYFNEQVDISDEEKEELLENFIVSCSDNDSHNLQNKEDMWNKCTDMIENLFKNDERTYVYIRDIEVPPDESSNLLQSLESHISKTINPTIEKLPGINTSMHYIGEESSFTAFHVEDGGLSSLNILKSGKEKIWLIIDYRWQAELEQNFFDYLKEHGEEVTCNQILQHKIYLITPKLLAEWKIPYTIVVQNPGDLFFIRSGTYHAIINMGKSLAEAINYGCPKWASSYQPGACKCEENNRNNVLQHRQVIVGYKECKKRLYSCDKEQCEELFLTKKKREEHIKRVHKMKFQCGTCSAAFSTESNLKRHTQRHSSNLGKINYDICNKFVVRAGDHKKRVHGEKKNCEKCLKSFSTYAIAVHRKICNIKCTTCLKTFTNQRYLTQHNKAKHPE